MIRCEPGSTHAVGQITTTATVFIGIGNYGRHTSEQKSCHKEDNQLEVAVARITGAGEVIMMMMTDISVVS